MSDVLHDTCESVDPYWTLHDRAFVADELVSDDGKYRVNGTEFEDDGYPPNAGRFLYYKRVLEGPIAYFSADLFLKFQSLEAPGTYGISASSLVWGSGFDKLIGFGIFQNGDEDKTLTIQIAGPEELAEPIVIHTQAMAGVGAFTKTFVANIRLQLNGSNLDVYLNNEFIVTVAGGFGGKVGFYLQKNWQPDGGTDNNVCGLIDNIHVDTAEFVMPISNSKSILDFEGDILFALADDGIGSISMFQNDLERDAGLESAILISLFSDKRATRDQLEALKLGSSDLRGWWGDGFAITPGDEQGSFLWFLERSKITPKDLSQAEAYMREALAWMTEDGLVKSITATAVREGIEGAVLTILVQRPEQAEVITFRYYYNWKAQELRRLV